VVKISGVIARGVTHSAIALYFCGAVLIALTVFGLTLPQPVIGVFGIGYGTQLDRFIVLVCVQAAVYFAAIVILLRLRADIAIWPLLVVAALMRVFPLLAPPFLSNDMYRYVWDGWVQAAGINPYRYIPADPHLAFLRDAIVYPNINRATYAHTIYPPAAEMIFWFITRATAFLQIPPVLAMKFCLLGFEALGMFAIVKLLDVAGLPRSRILIYAWNPLPVWEFASSGHVDAIAIAFVSLALWLASGTRNGRAGAALAVATLTKFFPVILIPAIWRRRDWTFATVFTALIVALYLPYLGAGAGVFGFLGGYSAQEGIVSGSGIFLSQALSLSPAATKAYLAFLSVILVGLGATMIFSRADPAGPRIVARRFMLLAGIVMLGLSPHYPWYYAWLLIPACVLPAPSILYLATLSPLLYLNPTHTKFFWPALLYIPFVAIAIRDLNICKLPSITGHALAEGDRP
jgi:membrane protein YdbS with pleckstrin-like domain